MGWIFASCFLKRRFQFHRRNFLGSLAAAVIPHLTYWLGSGLYESMNSSDILSQFEAYCGEEQFRKFLMAFHNLQQGRRRLLFWQEELLNEFCQAQGLELSIGFDALEPLFGDICPVHRVPLERARAPVVHKGRWAPPLDVIEARRERFPFANFVVEGGCVVVAGEEDYVETSYCDRCRAELIEWNRGRKEPYGLPPEDFDQYARAFRESMYQQRREE